MSNVLCFHSVTFCSSAFISNLEKSFQRLRFNSDIVFKIKQTTSPRYRQFHLEFKIVKIPGWSISADAGTSIGNFCLWIHKNETIPKTIVPGASFWVHFLPLPECCLSFVWRQPLDQMNRNRSHPQDRSWRDDLNTNKKSKDILWL